MINLKRFLAVTVLSSYVTTVLAGIIHEVLGHGLFILLFGGKITNVHISFLWPFELPTSQRAAVTCLGKRHGYMEEESSPNSSSLG
jgi:hypothetical protein